MSPTLNNPSRAWSAKSGNRVCNVAPCHLGLAGCTEDGIPITDIDPALVSITRAFIPGPQSISRTPARTPEIEPHATRATGWRTTHTARSQDVPSTPTDVSLYRDARFLRMPKTSRLKTLPLSAYSRFTQMTCYRRAYKKSDARKASLAH
jgi:hypothetical protein